VNASNVRSDDIGGAYAKAVIASAAQITALKTGSYRFYPFGDEYPDGARPTATWQSWASGNYDLTSSTVVNVSAPQASPVRLASAEEVAPAPAPSRAAAVSARVPTKAERDVAKIAAASADNAGLLLLARTPVDLLSKDEFYRLSDFIGDMRDKLASGALGPSERRLANQLVSAINRANDTNYPLFAQNAGRMAALSAAQQKARG
jgi:hypothetical protein